MTIKDFVAQDVLYRFVGSRRRGKWRLERCDTPEAYERLRDLVMGRAGEFLTSAAD